MLTNVTTKDLLELKTKDATKRSNLIYDKIRNNIDLLIQDITESNERNWIKREIQEAILKQCSTNSNTSNETDGLYPVSTSPYHGKSQIMSILHSHLDNDPQLSKISQADYRRMSEQVQEIRNHGNNRYRGAALKVLYPSDTSNTPGYHSQLAGSLQAFTKKVWSPIKDGSNQTTNPSPEPPAHALHVRSRPRTARSQKSRELVIARPYTIGSNDAAMLKVYPANNSTACQQLEAYLTSRGPSRASSVMSTVENLETTLARRTPSRCSGPSITSSSEDRYLKYPNPSAYNVDIQFPLRQQYNESSSDEIDVEEDVIMQDDVIVNELAALSDDSSTSGIETDKEESDDDSDDEKIPEPPVEKPERKHVPSMDLRPEKYDPETMNYNARLYEEKPKKTSSAYGYPNPLKIDIDLKAVVKDGVDWRVYAKEKINDKSVTSVIDRLAQLEKITQQTIEWENARRQTRANSRSRQAKTNFWREKKCCSDCLQLTCVGDCTKKISSNNKFSSKIDDENKKEVDSKQTFVSKPRPKSCKEVRANDNNTLQSENTLSKPNSVRRETQTNSSINRVKTEKKDCSGDITNSNNVSKTLKAKEGKERIKSAAGSKRRKSSSKKRPKTAKS